jgi:hypothetical protein
LIDDVHEPRMAVRHARIAESYPEVSRGLVRGAAGAPAEKHLLEAVEEVIPGRLTGCVLGEHHGQKAHLTREHRA